MLILGGGELTVLDGGHERTFAWIPSTLEWIASTQDCDFEFDEVTKGTQILLVYDLLITQRIGDGELSGIDPKLLPLYEGVRDMLTKPGFMATGKLSPGLLPSKLTCRFDRRDSRLLL